jgi:hypothetical protein
VRTACAAKATIGTPDTARYVRKQIVDGGATAFI